MAQGLPSFLKLKFMKYILIAAGLLFGTANLHAQTVGSGQRTGGATSPSPNTTSGKGNTSAGRNIPRLHGPRDVTPGSPVGTGGAGGGDMSGSPAGSAIETKDQTNKAVINQGSQSGKKASATQKKTTQRKTNTTTGRKTNG